MNDSQSQTKEFMSTFGQVLPDAPTKLTKETYELRINLILEELDEFVRASQSQDLVGVADALGDLLYVIYGAGCAYGIDLEPVFKEIHRSNMSKLWTEEEVKSNQERFATGELVANQLAVTKFRVSSRVVHPLIVQEIHRFGQLNKDNQLYVVKRTDGKIIKSPSYSPANLLPYVS